MGDWDQHLDEVLGAYNSTRHAITGFSPYMLTRGTEKAIPLTYLYTEFASQSYPTHDAYVDHVLARLQEIHDLVRRNTHQLKCDRNLNVTLPYEPKPTALQCIGKLFCCLSWNPGHKNSTACPWNACLWNPGLMM